MPSLDYPTVVLLLVGAFVAVTSLVTLMRRRRDEVLAELTAQARHEQSLRRAAEAKQKPAKRPAA